MANNKPVLIVIDIQREYSTPNRPFYINDILPSLNNANDVLTYARSNNWIIIHVKHLQKSGIFKSQEVYSDYIEGFHPEDTELEFIKERFSCYSSSGFAAQLEALIDNDIYVIGYSSNMCVLSTIIDGYHRRNKMIFINDCSNAKSDGGKSEQEIHEVMTIVLSKFCKIFSKDEVII